MSLSAYGMDMISLEAQSAVPYRGMIVFLSAAGQCDLAESTTPDIPIIGVTLQSTEDVEGVAQANVEVAVIKKGTGHTVDVRFGSTHTVVAAGDYIGTHASAAGEGQVATYTTTSAATLLASLQTIIGIALEALAVDTAGWAKVILMAP